MKTRIIYSLLFMLFCYGYAWGQTTNKGCIISIEDGTVNVDLTRAQVKVGDCIEVVESGGYMTHPDTGRRIKKEDRVVGTLEISQTYDEYSVATTQDVSLLTKLKEGMAIRVGATTSQSSVHHQSQDQSSNYKLTNNDILPTDDKVNIVIAPAQVNDVVNNGHFGGYVADILMEQMLMCDKVRLLDRSVLNAQIDEIELSGSVLDPATTIQQGRALGARYILQTTMQKPDVASVRTGIPLASMMGAIQAGTGTNIGAGYSSNINVENLRASVSLSVRVVDLQTGEVVFMSSGTGNAKGKSQVSFEYGALGGAELNGGVEGFKQTVTGKAIQQAFIKVGKNLKAYFNEETDRKVIGSVSGGVSIGDKMYAKGYKIFLGVEKLDKDGVGTAFADKPEMYFQYQKAHKKKTTSWILGGVGFLCIAAYAAAESTVAYPEVVMPVGVAGAGLMVWGICLNSSGKKKIKRIVDNYNRDNEHYSYTKPSSKQCSLSLTANGVRLTF